MYNSSYYSVKTVTNEVTLSNTGKASVLAMCPGNLYKTYSIKLSYGASAPTAIVSTQKLIYTIPESLRATGRVFKVVENDNGTIRVLDDLDTNDNTITFVTEGATQYSIVAVN